MIEIAKISGIDMRKVLQKDEKERILFVAQSEEPKVFCVINANTIEVRCDNKLGKLLQDKYESVMESRYFGRGGIEIVDAGQLEQNEIEDLVRLSYNLSLN